MRKMLCERFLRLCYHSCRVQRSQIVLISHIQRLTNVYRSLKTKGRGKIRDWKRFRLDTSNHVGGDAVSIATIGSSVTAIVAMAFFLFYFLSVIRQNVLKSGWRFAVLLDFVNWWKWIFSSNQRAITTTIQQRNCSGVVYLQKNPTIKPHSGIKCNTCESFVSEQNTVQQAQTEVKNEWVWCTDHSQEAAVSSPNARSSPPSILPQDGNPALS